MDAAPTVPEVEEAEQELTRVPLVLHRRNFSWLTERISGVVEQPAPRWWWVAFAITASTATFGRVCGLDLFYCLSPVLVHRFDSGFGDVARSGNHKGQKVSFRNFRVRLARIQSQLAPLRDGIPAFGRPFYSAGPLGAQRGIIRLRFDGYTDLAHHNLSALFRCGRDLRRVRDGAHLIATGPRDLQIA